MPTIMAEKEIDNLPAICGIPNSHTLPPLGDLSTSAQVKK